MRRRSVTALGVIALVLTMTVPALAAKPRASGTSRPFTEVEAGVRLSSTDSRYEDTYRIKRSPDGEGTTVRDAVLHATTFPASGTDKATSYYRNGRLNATETFTLSPPRTNGVGAITGKGKCTGGTEIHQQETCNYTFKGTYDLKTDVTHITLTGTETPAAGVKPTR
jgi:hypothetical protein